MIRLPMYLIACVLATGTLESFSAEPPLLTPKPEYRPLWEDGVPGVTSKADGDVPRAR